MAFVDNAWYVDSVNWAAVTPWATGAAIAAGTLRRQLATPTVNNERVFICIVAGTTHATTEPTWIITRGGKTTDNTVTWQECTGHTAVNGDTASTATWTITASPPGGVKATAVSLGVIIKRDNGASYQICSTAGTAGSGSEPSFSDTAGTTTADNTVTWTSLGVVGNFTGWQAPHARLFAAMAANWMGADDTAYIASTHVETAASTLTLNIAQPYYDAVHLLCVNKAGSRPPVEADLTTGASFSTTAGSHIVNIDGSVYCYGCNFAVGATTSAGSIQVGITAHRASVFENCTFTLVGTGAAIIYIGNTTGATQANQNKWINCTASFAAVGQYISVSGIFMWENRPGSSAVLGAAVPTTLFASPASGGGSIYLNGLDLSTLGSGKTLFSGSTGGLGGPSIIRNCKLGASVTVQAVPTTPSRAPVDLVHSDSGATTYRYERVRYQGTLTTETTIVRSGGAVDGTTPIAWQIDTTADPEIHLPFECPPIAAWNAVTGSSVTATVECRGAAIPNDNEVWVEVQYLGNASYPVCTIASDGPATILTTGAAQTSSSETWGGSTASFKLHVSFTPQMAGLIFARVMVAKVSSTFYIDPMVTLT